MNVETGAFDMDLGALGMGRLAASAPASPMFPESFEDAATWDNNLYWQGSGFANWTRSSGGAAEGSYKIESVGAATIFNPLLLWARGGGDTLKVALKGAVGGSCAFRFMVSADGAWHYAVGLYWGAQDDRLVILKNGAILATKVHGSPLSNSVWRDLEITVTGAGLITIAINGDSLQTTDTTRASGGMGLYTHASAAGLLVDNIRVE